MLRLILKDHLSIVTQVAVVNIPSADAQAQCETLWPDSPITSESEIESPLISKPDVCHQYNPDTHRTYLVFENTLLLLFAVHPLLT